MQLDFPSRVTIAVPTYVQGLHGREATTLPHGLITTIRIPRREVETIERAIKIIGFDISRGGFLRLCALRVAQEIIKFHENHHRRVIEERDARRTTISTVQSPIERDQVGSRARASD